MIQHANEGMSMPHHVPDPKKDGEKGHTKRKKKEFAGKSKCHLSGSNRGLSLPLYIRPYLGLGANVTRMCYHYTMGPVDFPD